MNEALAFVAGIIWSLAAGGIGYLVGRQRSRTLLADHATLTVTVPLTTANIEKTLDGTRVDASGYQPSATLASLKNMGDV